MNIFGQNISKCLVFQYPGYDSLNKSLVHEEFYNSKGQITYFYYKGFQESSSLGKRDSKNFNYYNDSLLVISTSVDETCDSTKIIYYYNNYGRKTKEEHYDFKRRLKKNNLNKRSYRCEISENNFEKKKTWKKIKEVYFTYDSTGNKILHDATKFQKTSQNRYTWKYDKNNRIIEHISFENAEIKWIEQYEYYNDFYKFIRTWFTSEGTPMHLLNKTDGYWPQFSFSYILNKQNQVIEEKVTNEIGELISSAVLTYNLYGRLVKKTAFDSKGQPEITHIYLYE